MRTNNLCATATGLRSLRSMLGALNIEWIQVQHLREDTEEFVGFLQQLGFRVGPLLGPLYSADEGVMERLRRVGIDARAMPPSAIEGALVEAVEADRAPSEGKDRLPRGSNAPTGAGASQGAPRKIRAGPSS